MVFLHRAHFILVVAMCCCMQGESEDMTFGESFVFSTLKDELVIGEVYVRVYNEQPTFVLEVNTCIFECVCVCVHFYTVCVNTYMCNSCLS